MKRWFNHTQGRKRAILEAGEAGRRTPQEVANALDQLRESIREQGEAQRRAATQATEAYQKQQAEVQEAISKIKQLKRETETLDDEHARLRQSFKAAFDAGELEAEEYRQALSRLDTKYDDLKRNQAQLKTTGSNAFGSGPLAEVKAFAAGFGGVAASVDVVRRALEFMREEKDRALESGDTLVDSRRRFAQVATNAQELQQLETLNNQVAESSGISRERAAQIVFQAKSTGFTNDAEFLGRIDPILSGEASAEFGKLRELFGKSLDIREITNATLKAAEASVTSADEFARGIAIVGEGGLRQGIAPSEQFASLSTLSAEFKSSDTAANRLKAFFAKAAQRDDIFGGLGAVEIVDRLQALRGGSEEEQKVFQQLVAGNQEVSAAFESIRRNRATIIQRQQEVQQAIKASGTADSEVAKRFNAFFDPSTEIGRPFKRFNFGCFGVHSVIAESLGSHNRFLQ